MYIFIFQYTDTFYMPIVNDVIAAGRVDVPRYVLISSLLHIISYCQNKANFQ